ncbi:HET-domain-containing protein [Hyaloscypha bicolor E]|uniref:HET-domain-containing protein n=1 Tax=Hyaloscypha bicolor E TaxID=1095630 RepID=A0A2J6SQX2_9HELO|nr:HET-domain-containing protein [Hyaloscypha bicolor E]PMD53177.1 HET-domain-containing protein [Hyaloscypha bicolor E]
MDPQNGEESDDKWMPDNLPLDSFKKTIYHYYGEDTYLEIDRYVRHKATGSPCSICGCQLCHSHPSSGDKKVWNWEISLIDLKKSAEKCMACDMIWQAALFATLDARATGNSINLRLEKPYNGGQLFLQCLRKEDDGDHWVTYEFYRSGRGADPPLFGIPTRPHVTGASKSNLSASIAWVKKQMKICDDEQEHPCYNATKTKFLLPKRVLDLWYPEEEPLETRVRLYEPKKNKKGEWATLSHCWGNTDPICTTTTNRKDFLQKIPWENISATYKDAIQITRLLGIRYLWIDSLCLIQDDREIWRAEASNMAEIYKNSYITIAATSAIDNDSGVLKPEPFTNSHQLTLFQPTADQRTPEVVIARETVPVFIRKRFDHKPFSMTKEFEEPRLLTRAWIYQERILSPRIIHFCDNDLVWECEADFACQCGFLDQPGPPVATVKQGQRNKLAGGKWMKTAYLCTSTAPRDVKVPQGDLRFKWKSFRDRVSDYGRLDLKFPRDRLRAIGGIARQYQPSECGSYFAGLWKETLAQDLTWHASGEKHTRESWEALASGNFVAPSWSWASVTHPSYYLLRSSEEDEPLFDLIDCHIKWKGDDEFGECESGFLILSGLKQEATLILMRSDESHGETQHFWVKIPLISTRPSVSVNLDYQIDHQHFSPIDLPEGDSGSLDEDNDSWIEDDEVAIGQSKEKFTVFLLSTYAALLLRKVNTEEGEFYTRAGIVLGLRELDFWNDLPMTMVTIK